ncbi:MAG: energy-coupled thiamine transporter ThiT [Oscillospiraceae bacterium]|nr:energy-coupled thiamine transporter ThiT [Oscillospiraceae bacterium]
MQKNTNQRVRRLVEGAVMIAVAYVLSFIKLYQMPLGGSVTLEMIPLIIMGLRNGVKWGCLTGFVHGLLQMIMGFSNVMYCPTLLSQIGCILMDYLLAYTALGLAGAFAKPFGERRMTGAIVGTVVCGALQFLCSFISGWLVWGSYYESVGISGTALMVYSLTYNGSYMLPNTILAALVVALLYRAAPKLFAPRAAA